MAPNARLIMFVLISAADPDTAAIPDRFTPSLEEIAGRSGLSKSAVAEWLTVLEDSGWVKRDRPSTAESFVGGRRTRYQLAIGDQLGSPKPKRERKRRPANTKGADTTTKPTVRTADSPHGGRSKQHEGPRGGQSAVRAADSHGPHGGHKRSPSQQAHLPPSGGSADAPPPDTLFDIEDDHKTKPAPVDDTPKTNVLLADWIDFLKTKNIKLTDRVKGHYSKVIDQVIDQGFTERIIKQALTRMFDRDQHGSPALLENFIVDVQKKPTAPAPKGPKSTAPARLDQSEKCQEHRRPLPCGLCRADQLARKKTHAA